MKHKTLLIATTVFLTANLLAGCGSLGSTPTEAPVVDNQPGNAVISTVSASGEVIPEKWVSLGFSGGGQSLILNVNPGDIVDQGKLLAEVDHIGAKASLENARAQLANAKAQLERLEDLDDVATIDLDAARAAITAAEAFVDQAYDAWMKTYLNAPFAGTIVNINARNGENAMPGQEILMLADLTSLQVVTTDMSEVDVVHVKVGNAVNVSFDALPDITTTGRVAKIGLSKSTGSGVYYKITITLDEIPEELLWGMSAFVVISVDNIVSTSTPTLTSTTTPTITPTITPTLGTVLYKVVVNTLEGDGVNLRREPNGDIIESLWDGILLEVLEEKKVDGVLWLRVRTDDDVEGWIVKSAASTPTPTPNGSETATPTETKIPYNPPPETDTPVPTATEVPTDPPTEVPTEAPTTP